MKGFIFRLFVIHGLNAVARADRADRGEHRYTGQGGGTFRQAGGNLVEDACPSVYQTAGRLLCHNTDKMSQSSACSLLVLLLLGLACMQNGETRG